MSADLAMGLVAGAAAGLATGLLLCARRLARAAAAARSAEERLADARASEARLADLLERSAADLTDTRVELARVTAELEHTRREAQARADAWEADRERLSGEFAQLSARALQQNNEQFLALAASRLDQAQAVAREELAQRERAIAQLLRPLGDTLARYEEGIRQLELDRKAAYAGLTEQVRHISASHEQLQRETRNLVTALRSPQTRGRWGEVQLRRVVEMAGMVPHCDFEEQVSTEGPDGRLRPDLVVRLPGGAQVVVDAKVPLDAFLRAAEADDDDVRRAHLVSHARQLRAHVDQLAKKQYWGQFDPSPEFVVAFVPGDPLLAAGFEHDPALVEHALANRVLLATPTTLIALLRTVAYGWQQDALAHNARLVQRLGTELHERLRILGGHLGKLHRSLSSAVEAFNDTVGSLESRVLVTARRFVELGVVGEASELPELKPVLATPRRPQAPELDPSGDPPAGQGAPLPAEPPAASPLVHTLPGHFGGRLS
ncbi:MAG TPA: DNA recombination protein RmuC [Acidimicrobiales bacterium]|nr:DNA recombination protein RmuC [Acidimicrobiales bacterium]